MIDYELTSKRLGVECRFADTAIKGEYHSHDHVIVRCDFCDAIFGKPKGTMYFYVAKRRGDFDGKDVCLSCQSDRKNPLRDFSYAKRLFIQIVNENDQQVPARQQLPNNLIGAINRHHGGYRSFVERCGYEHDTKPHRYWNEWTNLESELKPICEEFGHVPSVTYLAEINASLPGAISFHGGVAKVAKQMGFPIQTGYWADDGHFVLSYYEFVVDNILYSSGVPHSTHPEIVPFDRRRGDFLVGNVFIEVAGYERLTASVRHRVYHDSLREKISLYKEHDLRVVVIYKEDFADVSFVIEKLQDLVDQFGVSSPSDLDIENAIRPVTWWANWENVQSRLQPIIVKLGHFPTARELENAGESSLAHYIMALHGGFSEARRLCGAPVRQQAPGYFADWSKVEAMFLPVCEELGYFPSAKQIRKGVYGVTDCCTSLYKHWGSLKAVARKLGFPTKREFNLNQNRKGMR